MGLRSPSSPPRSGFEPAMVCPPIYYILGIWRKPSPPAPILAAITSPRPSLLPLGRPGTKWLANRGNAPTYQCPAAEQRPPVTGDFPSRFGGHPPGFCPASGPFRIQSHFLFFLFLFLHISPPRKIVRFPLLHLHS